MLLSKVVKPEGFGIDNRLLRLGRRERQSPQPVQLRPRKASP
jgi:hypothetical protein